MFHSRLCSLNDGAAPCALFPVLAPNDNGDATEPTQPSLGTNGTWPEAPDVGWAVWWFWHRGLSGMPTLCLPVVCPLPARGYSQLFMFSRRCGLTTPPFMQVLPIKRPNRCGIRARYCDALCAAMMTQFLYRLSCSFRLGVAAVGGNGARASCTSWCGGTRGLCVQKWFGLGDECTRLSFERRGAVLRTYPPASVCTSAVNCCSLRAGCCGTVCMGRYKMSGKVKLG